MAEDQTKGQRFNFQKPQLSSLIPGGGGQTQQTQQTQQQDTSGQQATGGIFLPGISDNAELQAQNKLPQTGYAGAIQNGTIKSNVSLPGINTTPTTISHIDPSEAIEGMRRFNEEEDKRITNEYVPLLKRGFMQWKGQVQKWGNANLSKEGILEKLARIGQVNGANYEAMQEYIDENQKQSLEYNEQVNTAFKNWEKRNMDMKLLEQYDQETISGLLSRGDGKGATYKLIKGLAENFTMIPEMIVTAVAPEVGLPLIAGDVYIQENQSAFEEMIENGATYDQAINGATIVGVANASIEILLERFLGGVQRAGASTFRRLFTKNFQKEVVRNITKKGFAEILGRGIFGQTKSSSVEGLEEILQQLISNAFVKTVNSDKDLTEGMLESFDQAFWQSFFFPLGGGSESVISDIQSNRQVEKNADLEALQYVLENEERKAQRMKTQKMKNSFLNPTMDNGYTPSKEQAEQRAREKEENEQYEEELRLKQNEEVSIENSMIDDVLNDEEDSRYQKKEISATDESEDSSSLADQSPTGRVRISPENSSEITKSLNEIKNNLDDLKADTFLQQIKKSISGNEKNSNYVVNKINGMNYVLRVSDHHANSYQFDNSKQRKRNTSIVVKLAQKSKFKKNKNVDLAEFVYDPANMTTEKMQGIIDGIQNWIKTGEYTDTNYDSKNQSTRKRGDAKYQLKYEDKNYKPGVAGKNEKSISGKEGVNLISKLNKQTIKELAEKYGIKVEVIEGMIEILENGKRKGYAYGKYIDQLLTLSEEIKESTAPHELLHAIFDMIDPETKAYLISQVMKSEGWSAKQAEEWLADSFSNFYRTGKIEGAPKSTWGKIKMFFKRVRSFINGLGKWRSQLEEIFTDIIESEGIEDLQGKIDQSKSLNEAKAKMKQRFLEYSKNAQKMQKKAKKSEAKYQEAKDIRDLTLNNEKKEGAYDPRASLPKVRGGWTKAKIEKQIKEGGATVGISGALRAIQEFDSPEDFRAHTFYHGTQGSFVAKPSMSIPEKTFDRIADNFGGGYGQRYWAISLTTDKRIASHFGGASDHVNIYPVILRKNATVIEMPELEDSADLDDYIEKLWNDGVDAVWIGDKNSGEKELAVLNPKAIVDLGASDSYRQYRLGSEDNPLRIKSDADFDRIYNNAGKYIEELRTIERKYINVKDKYFLDNFGSTPGKLMDEDWNKYKEAKKQWESSKEKEEYDKYKSEYNKRKWEIGDDIRYQTVDGSEREVKANIIQDPVKGKMYHVTTEEFENFRESDEYDDDDRRDWNDSFGTYVTDAQQFFEDFTQTSPRDNGSGWKKFEIDVDIKKPVLHPYRTWREFGFEKADEMIIDYLQLVDRFTPEMQKELVALKNMSMEGETEEEFDYDNYPFKDSYTKEEILAMPGGISSAILDAQFVGEGEPIVDMLFGDDASRDREYLKKKGYDAIMIYEGEKDGPIFSYALFYPNRYAKKNLGIKYQLPTEVDPDISSPNEMVHKRGQLMVIDKFISEEQKKKALDVSKDILVHDGSHLDGLPYMWMHTNKYNSKIIPNFINTKDNKYKEFSDKGIVVSFFTNSEDMSKSYADQRSVIANTKKFKSIEEFNKMFRDDSNWTTSEISGDPIKTIFETKIVKDGDEYVIHKINEDLHKYTSIDDMYKKFMPRDRKEGLSDNEKIQAVKKYAKDNFMGEDFSLYDGIDINKDGKDIIVRLRSDKELGRYKTEKGALANARSQVNKEGKYHYTGIIQNMHNPFVVDKKIYGDTTPNWNRLGTAYDFLKKTDEEQLNKLVNAINEVYGMSDDLRNKSFKLRDRAEKIRDSLTKELNDNRMDNFTAKANKDENEIARTNHRESEIWSKREKFDSIIDKLSMAIDNQYYDLTETAQEVINSYLNEYNIKERRSLYNAYMKLINEYKNFYSYKGSDNFAKFAKDKYGVDDATLSVMHGIDDYRTDNGEKILKDKWMQTNDFVFYALRKGGYDGVMFGRIYDYGGDNRESKWGGNVLVTFNSNQFKSWDNADPTDSEFISYQLSDDLDSEAFKKRFGDSKVVDENGNPLVVYHGTPNGEFWSFDKRKASTEGDRGAGFYFTDNEYDVGNNYVGGGPDFDNKVARLAERIEQDEGISYEEAKEKAREQLYIGENQIDAVLKIENPVRVGDDATDIIGEWRDNSVEEYNEEDFDNEDDYYRALDEARANALDDIHRAIGNIGLDYGIDDAIQKVDQRFMENDYGTAQQLKDYLNDGSLEAMMGDQYANNEVARAVLEGLGYDGIIDNSVSEKFRNMGLDYGTTHYIVFEPNQIKSATDNKGTYDPNYNDIRYQTVYHGSQADFDRFDSSHMGEGEGAQAHGWGHYVAVDENTGRRYADMRHYNYEVEIDGKTITNEEDLWDVPYFERELYRNIFRRFAMNDYGTFEEDLKDVIDRQRKDYEEVIQHYEDLIANPEKPLVGFEDVDMDQVTAERRKQLEGYVDALEKLEELTPEDVKVRETDKKRNLYEVEIPDPVKADTPTGSNYLEEGKKPTRNQYEKFKNELEKYVKNYMPSRIVNLLDVKYEDLNGWGKANVGGGGGALYDIAGTVLGGDKQASKFLESLGYDGIHYFGGRDGEAYVIFNDDALEIKNHERYQIAEYDYDENGNRKWLKFGEDNSEFDPSIFDRSREDQIDADKENEKSSPFYNAWVRYNAQNYKDDQLTLEEFINEISKRGDKEQEIYDQKMRDIGEAQKDPKMLDLQLRAVKLMEEEGQVGKKFGKNVSKEVRDRQQAEVEKKREQLVKDIFDWMYPGLRFEDATYDDQKMADQKEAEWEMLGKEDIEEKLKYFKKDKNGNREAKEIKVENPDIKLEKILSSGKWEEIFTPVDRVIEWKTPQGQHGVIDNQKDPKKYKSVMEKINSGKTKTKVTLKDVTQEYRALEKYRAEQEAEKERKKKERQEAFAKKQQEEYKKMVRMKAFQRLIDMQWLEKYPFLTESEIKQRYGFTDEEWKKVTEQDEIKLPKKRGDKARSDFNKAVDSEVRNLIEGLGWQNNMKQRDAEKNLGEIGEIDIDVLLGRDEEKGQKEVDEFKKLAKEKGENNAKKRIKNAVEEVSKVEIDTERENSKSEKQRVDRLIKSTKTDRTVRGSVKQFTSDILTPVSTKIRNISKKIHMEVMRYFQNKDILTNTRLKEVDPFLKAMGKIRKENPVRFMDIWVALANRNIGYANGLLAEYGVKVPTRLLDEIYLEADDVGLNINYLGSYYPLSVKAPKSFLEELMKVNEKDIASEIEKRIQKESQKKGGPLEESEVTAIINSVIAGEEKGPDVNTGNKHLKKRNTEIKWTPKMLEYCDDPISTLISYIEGMTQSIERAKFLGKSRSGNVHTLADYVYNAKNGLTPDQQDELMDLLKAVFNDESPNKFIQTWRDLGTLTTLGSPSSTLTQLGDLSFSVYENGWRETLKAVRDLFASRGEFNLVDMGVLNRGEEYTNINSQRNLLQKAIHNVFKLTFFSTFDTFGKSTYIQSTWRKRQKRAKQGEKGDAQFRKDIMKWTDDEFMTDKIINDIKQGRFSQEVALLMYMKLSNIQPLTKAQMPKVYLNNPNGRLFYQFKTFGIKQLDYVLQETKEQTKNFKNLSTIDKFLKIAQVANMVFIMTLLGVGADELKDLTMRRRSNSLILRWLMGEKVGSEQIWEKMADNVLKLFGLSRYTVMQMKSDPVDAITSLFTTLPATNLVNYPFKDIYKAFKDDGSINWRTASSYQLIPLVGKYRYWIFGGGQEKQKEALKKSKKKKKSGGSLL